MTHKGNALFHIGPYAINGYAVLAPMAGITDQPFRNLCRAHGAALAVSEMVTSQTHLWKSRKSQNRLQLQGENGLRSVQIAGNEPEAMAEAAKGCVEAGAHIVDINMGCPAKKVCNKAAGSALLQDEGLVEAILTAVVEASPVPVTLKIRTGWSTEQRNGTRIAEIAQNAGVRALAVHGRTRACRFNGHAEYDTIADIVKAITIPVIANGDITSAEKAEAVLEQTGAAAVMIGRGAEGNPWIFEAINRRLGTSQTFEAPKLRAVRDTLLTHLDAMHEFYGSELGVRIARKHFAWYLEQHLADILDAKAARQAFNTITTPKEQIKLASTLFSEHLPLEEEAA